jgi:uncharacterized protein
MQQIIIYRDSWITIENMATRSRRLRKKLHIGEFREWGFQIRARMANEIDHQLFSDRFISEAIEANGLLFGGTCWQRVDGFVVFSGSGSANENHQKVIAAWLKGQPEVIDFDVGPLVDAWY